MEAGREAPLKVCPHCSVATRTAAEVCPSCGGSYLRGRRLPRLRWTWWLAIPIVVAAFLVGYFGISRLVDGDGADAGEITLQEAQGVSPDLSRDEVEDRLGEPAVVDSPDRRTPSCLSQAGERIKADEVVFYSVSDAGDSLWQFCFKADEQVGSSLLPG
jgi:hypothetical protein